jgi:phage shock protein PspC (stress-responsive transcriptional regulator)
MKKDINNKVIFGVCSGLAKEFKIDVSWIRLAFVIAALMGFGLPIIIYIILAIILPTN